MTAFLKVLAVAGALLVGPWALMLLVGVVHSDWIPALPTIGYWTAVQLVVIVAGFRLVAGLALGVLDALDGAR